MKYDFNDITFCVFCRIDNEERAQNLKAMVSFYRKYSDNVKFIISEDGTAQQVPSLIDLTDRDVYTFQYNDTEWRKSEGYNKCIKLAKTNTLVFNDVDVVVHPDQIIDTHDQLCNDSKTGLLYPYNGLFLCTDKDVKDEFIKSEYNIDTLNSRFPQALSEFDGDISKRSAEDVMRDSLINRSINGILIGHLYSKGGIVMGRRDNIIRCNGYNPMFKGWGYEDDEFPFRVSKLGYVVGRLPGKKKPCWHLHHFDGTGSKKETQEFYDDNNNEVLRVQQMNKEEMEQYKTGWRL